ncbi:unnamed protein product, partial [Urochloa humidicola]
DFAQYTQEGGADQFVLIPDSDEERAAKGSSLLGDEDEFVPETEPQDVPVSRTSGSCANQGRQHLGTMLHEWLRLISNVENTSGKINMESSKVQFGGVKLEEESDKVEMDDVKLEVELGSVKVEEEELDSVKEELDNVKLEKKELDDVKLEKEELNHMVSFSDIETDDETCLFQDGVDLRGYSQVEDDDF